MDFLVILIPIWIVMGAFGAWVAMAKNRSPIEGLMLGLLFGPFGVLITALLPNESDQGTTPASTGRIDHFTGDFGLDDRGKIAYLATRYRELLDELEPNWQSHPYHRKKILMQRFDRQLMKELKLTPHSI